MADDGTAVATSERRQRLLDLLQDRGRVSVRLCSDVLGVSEVTIRSDLAALEREGQAERVWGGAVLPQPLRQEGSFASRLRQRQVEKQRIARAAAALINDGDTVMLDASTTAYFIAKQLGDRRNLTVITNGLHVALELGPYAGITTIVIGGQVRGVTGSLVGTIANDVLQKLHAQRGFFSARGLTAEKGLTESTLPEGAIKTLLIEHVAEVVAVLDSSKLGANSLTSFCPIGRVGRLITAGDNAEAKTAPFAALFPVMVA